MRVTRQPPTWGARGQGWVAAQFALLGLALVIGVLDLSGWPDSLRDGLRYVGVLLISGGVVIAVYAVLGLGSSLTAATAPVEHGQLRTDGIYGVVRLPIYSALLVIVLGWALVSTPWLLLVLGALAVELDLKRQVEEGFLERRYDDYARYRERVPWAFVPWVR